MCLVEECSDLHYFLHLGVGGQMLELQNHKGILHHGVTSSHEWHHLAKVGGGKEVMGRGRKGRG